MSRNQVYKYFVEGDDDKKMIEVLKTDYEAIFPGKVEKFNVTCKIISRSKVMQLKQDTIVILVFDTDRVDSTSIKILDENIKFLKNQRIIKKVWCVTQVRNLEDELVRSCNIKQVKELTGSKSNKDFKSDILHITNLRCKLDEKQFELKKFWNCNPDNEYSHIQNEALQIKQKI